MKKYPPYFEKGGYFFSELLVQLSSADLTAAIDTTTEECQQRCGDNVEQGNDLI